MRSLTTLPLEEITREEFSAFEYTRQSGVFNMMADSKAAAEFSELSRDTYWSILHHYSALLEKWPEVKAECR